MNVQTKTAEPTVINGINVDDLFALIQRVKQDAAKGQTNWRVTTTWQGQTRSRTQVEDFGIGGETVPRRFSTLASLSRPGASLAQPASSAA
jgi:hypothetical protein